jgi:uncharacterized membrane protein
MQNRLRSWPLWVALASLVVFVVKQVWGVDINDTVDGLLDVLLPVLIGFGIVNNPQNPNGL